ncbi:MAG: NAD-dependent protein deacetylase [Granulosicoccus sp.]
MKLGSFDSYDRQLSEFLQRYPRLLVLTGAGISTASGLGDYRDKSGQWKRKQPITGQVFINNEAARKRYWARSSVGWPSFSCAEPGTSHTALRALEKKGHIELLVTQNVDRLHQKAGHENSIDLHGVLASVSCIDCPNTIDRDDFQTELLHHNDWLNHLTADHAPDGDADLELDSLNAMHVPACKNCGGLLKPDVVFFGETVPKEIVSRAMRALATADALLVAGSSLMVYSGFRFCREAQKLHKPIAIVNDGLTRADDLALLKIEGDCGERLSKLAASVV